MAKKEAKKEKSATKREKKPRRRFRVNKKLNGKVGTIFIGAEDPFLYFPDMMSYLEREEIDEVKLKARGKSISNVELSFDESSTENNGRLALHSKLLVLMGLISYLLPSRLIAQYLSKIYSAKLYQLTLPIDDI